MTVVRRWLKETAGAPEAADWILGRAEINGCIPNVLSWPVDDGRFRALVALFSNQYLSTVRGGAKFRLLFDRWEQEVVGTPSLFLATLGEARGRALRNRRQERQTRAVRIGAVLQGFADHDGLPGFVAKRELEALANRRGRCWSRSQDWEAEQIETEFTRYFNLLRYVEELRHDPARIERLVHVSRIVAGDTHWLRPGNQVWRDLALDVLQFDPLLNERTQELAEKERAARALGHVGLAENLTSITVLAFGRFSLRRGGRAWNWAIEAAEQGLPVWFSAQHLFGSRLFPLASVREVISVENETSFLDLLETSRVALDRILVYTEGHANRAVIAMMRLLSQACPAAVFRHQGDLDLPGVRILASLAERTGVRIEPAFMDAETYRRFASSGIALSDGEYEDAVAAAKEGGLPCQDLLQQIVKERKRIEQETITAATHSDGRG